MRYCNQVNVMMACLCIWICVCLVFPCSKPLVQSLVVDQGPYSRRALPGGNVPAPVSTNAELSTGRA